MLPFSEVLKTGISSECVDSKLIKMFVSSLTDFAYFSTVCPLDLVHILPHQTSFLVKPTYLFNKRHWGNKVTWATKAAECEGFVPWGCGIISWTVEAPLQKVWDTQFWASLKKATYWESVIFKNFKKIQTYWLFLANWYIVDNFHALNIRKIINWTSRRMENSVISSTTPKV